MFKFAALIVLALAAANSVSAGTSPSAAPDDDVTAPDAQDDALTGLACGSHCNTRFDCCNPRAQACIAHACIGA